jgi:hypothetical protein
VGGDTHATADAGPGEEEGVAAPATPDFLTGVFAAAPAPGRPGVPVAGAAEAPPPAPAPAPAAAPPAAAAAAAAGAAAPSPAPSSSPSPSSAPLSCSSPSLSPSRSRSRSRVSSSRMRACRPSTTSLLGALGVAGALLDAGATAEGEVGLETTAACAWPGRLPGGGVPASVHGPFPGTMSWPHSVGVVGCSGRQRVDVG